MLCVCFGHESLLGCRKRVNNIFKNILEVRKRVFKHCPFTFCLTRWCGVYVTRLFITLGRQMHLAKQCFQALKPY